MKPDDFIETMMQYPDGPLILWHQALGQLCTTGKTELVMQLLRHRIPPTPDDCEFLADLFDPSKAEFGQLKFAISPSLRRQEREGNMISLGEMVLRQEQRGEKRYLAVQQIAKSHGFTERHVWKALKATEQYWRSFGSDINDIAQRDAILSNYPLEKRPDSDTE
jgi:hypothetical protein